jgi:hypothetical protein
MQAGSRRRGVWTCQAGKTLQRPPATANTLTGAKLADAAFQFSISSFGLPGFSAFPVVKDEKMVIDYTQVANFYSRKIHEAERGWGARNLLHLHSFFPLSAEARWHHVMRMKSAFRRP